MLVHRVEDTLIGLISTTLRLLDHIGCCRLLLHNLLLCGISCLSSLGRGVRLRRYALLHTTDVLDAELLLIMAFEAVFQDLDGGLQL